MSEGSDYFTAVHHPVTTNAGVDSGSFLVRQFPQLTAKLADREAPTVLKEAAHLALQPMPEDIPEPVHDRVIHVTSSSGLPLPSNGNRSLLPTPSVLLSHWWHMMLLLLQHHSPASQAFVETFYRAMLRRVRYCYGMSPVRPSICDAEAS